MKGFNHLDAKILGFENLSLWQRLNSITAQLKQAQLRCIRHYIYHMIRPIMLRIHLKRSTNE